MTKLLTIPQYCLLEKVSRQAVYANKVHTDKIVSLPVFVEFEGKKIEIEKRKFVKI